MFNYPIVTNLEADITSLSNQRLSVCNVFIIDLWRVNSVMPGIVNAK